MSLPDPPYGGPDTDEQRGQADVAGSAAEAEAATPGGASGVGAEAARAGPEPARAWLDGPKAWPDAVPYASSSWPDAAKQMPSEPAPGTDGGSPDGGSPDGAGPAPDTPEPSPDAAQAASGEAGQSGAPVQSGAPGQSGEPGQPPRPSKKDLEKAARQRLRAQRAQRARARQARAAQAAALLLARLSVLPAVLLLAWLIPAVALLFAGRFQPGPMVLISVPLAVVLAVGGLRVVPASWPRLLPPGRTAERTWTSWFGLLATVAVVAALTAWQLTESSQSLIVVRDPGVYLQTGYWLAQHGSLPIPQMQAAFGGAHPGLSFASTGFLARGGDLYPSVTPGLPMLLAGGFWVNGVVGASAVGPLLGGLAMLSFAGLVARLVGPQWAPAGALILGISLPQQYVGRTSLSESALQIALFGGCCLLADSLAVRGRAAAAGRQLTRWQALVRQMLSVVSPLRVLAALAGLSLGFGLAASLDALVYLLAVIPFGCALVVGRRPQASPFLAGGVIGAGCGVAVVYVLDRPFLDSVGRTAALAGVVAVWLVAVSAVIFQLARLDPVRRFVPRLLASRGGRWLPVLGPLFVLAGLVGFAARPYVQKVHGTPSPASYSLVETLQRQQGLPVDPTRLYSEQTLYWVIWYIGLPTVLLGAFGLALVVRRCWHSLQTWRDPAGVWRIWSLPALIIGVGTVAALWYPDIDPDQPWASRRLIVVAIPGLILGALWAASWLGRRAHVRGARSATAGLAGLFCAAAMLLPAAATTFGVGLAHSSGASALKVVVQGMARQRIGVGQESAVTDLCARIPRNASVVFLDRPTAAEFAPVVRGMCGVPTAWMASRPVASVDTVIAAIVNAGRTPVLLAGSAAGLAGFSASPEHVLGLVTTGYPQLLTQLPTSPVPLEYELWMTTPAGSPGA